MWANKSGSVFQAEAVSLLDWYENIILKNYEVLNSVKAGVDPIPTEEEYIASLPVYQKNVE